jgi:hypothetical protein
LLFDFVWPTVGLFGNTVDSGPKSLGVTTFGCDATEFNQNGEVVRISVKDLL